MVLGLNESIFLDVIVNVSPVCGFRPLRSAFCLTSKLPNPATLIFSPDSTHEREEIDRLSVQLERLRKVLTNILALADELKEGTIDKILAKSDLELGIEVLLRGKL